MAISKIDSQMSEINVTPLVDVMLVLLVIFMITAPLMQRGLDVNLPQANAGTVQYHEDQLMVVISQSGKVSLQDQVLTIPDLKKKLSALSKDNPNIQVYLAADQNVRYGIVVTTIAAIKNAGVTRLGMVTNPPSELPEKL